jgi:hypothetical protein
MSTRAWVIVGALVLLLAVAGGAVVYSKDQVAKALRDAFEAVGLDGDWGVALGETETHLTMGAVNDTGGDHLRGGSYGPTQISTQTARAYGYTGPMEALTTDLQLAANLSAKIAAAGAPDTLEDFGAWWNAGRRSFDALPLTAPVYDKDGKVVGSQPHPTRNVYVPALVKAYERIAA